MIKIYICPFCENEVDPDHAVCCGEYGHYEEIEVCEDYALNKQIKNYERDLDILELSCQI